MNYKVIEKEYVNLSDDKIKLYCSYTTRFDGFIDVLMSGKILTSQEVCKLLGMVKTHRGNSMTVGERVNKDGFFDQNDYISLSTGFVSFKYSNSEIENLDNYVGGVGVLIPLENILLNERISFSHCIDYDNEIKLSKKNIYKKVHKKRREGRLGDDGYGNVFEIILESKVDKKSSNFARILTYAQIDLNQEGLIIAIPNSEKGKVIEKIEMKKVGYKKLLDKLSKKNLKEFRMEVIDGREINYPKKTIEHLETLISLVKFESLPIYWYDERNLDIAMKRVSILSSLQ